MRTATVVGVGAPPSRLFLFSLFGLLAYAAWVRGGVYAAWQWPLVSMAALMLGGVLLADHGPMAAIRKAMLRDPLFYMGALFLVLLGIQWANSDYYVVWRSADTVGMHDLPPRWAPWSVEPETASQMVEWFFPAWVALLTVRHVLEAEDLLHLLYLMAWNAALLAVVGIGQQWIGPEKMLGLWTIPGGGFFATFGYENHAAAWFYLHAAVSAGLAHRALVQRLPPAQAVVWLLCFVLCLTAAFASLSRAAGLAGLVLVVTAFFLLARWAWRRSGRSHLVNAVGLACVAGLAGVVLYLGSGDGALAQEIGDTLWGEKMDDAVNGRIVQLPSAWEVAKDYPLFGCGGWGYRWMALLHIPVGEWGEWRGAGKANVHCDPLQFLVEFGWIGSLLLAGTVGVLIHDARKQGKVKGLAGWIGLGLLLVFLHSWVDLPYRNPAILLAWCTLLAALARLPQGRKSGWIGSGYE